MFWIEDVTLDEINPRFCFIKTACKKDNSEGCFMHG